MEPSMFDTLLSLPLFQGLGHDDLTRILESTRLDFDTIEEGHVLHQQDQPCTGLLFLLEGKVISQRLSADRSWSVEEILAAPSVVGLEVLYGSTRHHLQTLTTASTCRLLFIDKRTISALTAYFEVFRLNVLNQLTTAVVRNELTDWLPAEENLRGRIRAFMRAHVSRPAGRKRFNIPMWILGRYLGEDKRYVSYALHEMQAAGLLIMERRSIEVPSFEALLKADLGAIEKQ